MPLAPETLAPALATFVGAKQSDGYMRTCAAEAVELITHHVAGASVPEAVLTRAALETAADLYHRRSARNGVVAFDESDMSASPIRISRDPMAAARPILAPFLTPGIA